MSIQEFFERCLFIKRKSFPFTNGKGLVKALEILGFKAILDFSQKKITLTPNSTKNSYFSSLFFKCIHSRTPFRKCIHIRPDNMRKRFKVSFHSDILKIMTGKKKNNAKKKSKEKSMHKFPQNFITNVNILDNSLVMNLTYEELLLNIKKENKNVSIELDENAIWNEIKDMTYRELIEAYLLSAEFEKSIMDLKIKSEKRNKTISALYIETYINLALTYTDFYSSIPLKKEKSFSSRTNSINIFSDNTNTIKTANNFTPINSGNPFSLNLIANNTIFSRCGVGLLTEEENYSLNESLDSINNLEEKDERNFIINVLEQNKRKFL